MTAPTATTATTAPAAQLRLNPAKLVRSKWTACAPVAREKHFMVIALVEPIVPGPCELVTIEAVHSGRRFELPWRALRDGAVWRQGWV